MVRNCLIVDDNSMSDDADAICIEARKKGITLSFHKEFGIGSQSRVDLLDNDKNIDSRKVIEAFEREYAQKSIQLFAVDFDFEDEAGKFTGLEAVRIIRQRFRKSIIILYSANLDSVAQRIIKSFNKDEPKETLDRIKSLFSAKITSIVKREKLNEAIISELDKKPADLEELLIKELEALPEVNFRSEVVDLKNKATLTDDLTPKRFIEEIQSGSAIGKKLSTELIQRTLAFWVDYNQE